ncbi:AraC family transcriptional regulator [Haloferula sp. BvORR071]|uniref:AraC family transcriptional regulator n=1 Tax=Haloferula sp. BvORR071 TaxID=1396141 RepID=UPI000698A4C8|nr:AraC family transcriptional regulator [Haloferula sp. BvORR071]
MNPPPYSREAFLAEMAAAVLHPLYDLMPDVSFFIKDTAGRFVALSRLGCEFCGVKTEEDAFGCTDLDFFPESRAAEYMADDRLVIASGQPIVNRIEPAPEMEGSPRLVVTNKIPVRDRNGSIIGVAGFSRRVEHLRCATTVIRKLAAAVDQIHQHYAESFDTADLAKQAGLSTSQFERLFRKALGSSPRQYLQRVRIEHACLFLVESEDTVAAIAQRCGYYDHAHFTKAFVALKGKTPTAFRKERQASLNAPSGRPAQG